jgi:hypothetical protein
MDDNLRTMIDAVNDLTERLHRDTWKLDQIMFALAEECEDNAESDEIPAMLHDAAKHVKAGQGSLAAVSDYITDIGKELL